MNDQESNISELLHRAVRDVRSPLEQIAVLERRAKVVRWRNRGYAAILAGVAVLALSILLPSLRATGHTVNSGRAAAPASGLRSTPDSPAPIVENQPPPNGLSWYYRGSLPVGSGGTLDSRAARAWAVLHGIGPDQASLIPLLGVSLPDGTSVLVLQMYQLWAPPSPSWANTVVYSEVRAGAGRIERDGRTPVGIQQVSWEIADSTGQMYVIILGPQTAGSIEIAPDGRALQPATRMTGYQGGRGWAVFRRPPGMTSAARIRIGGPGNSVLYYGPLDMYSPG